MDEKGAGGTSSRPSRRFLSLGTKLGVGTLAVVLVASVLVFVQLIQRDRESLVAAKRTAADMVADLFAASLGAPLDFGDEDALESVRATARRYFNIVGNYNFPTTEPISWSKAIFLLEKK